jgi:hypothetical protein
MAGKPGAVSNELSEMNTKRYSRTENANSGDSSQIVIKDSQEFFIQLKSQAIYDENLSAGSFRTLCLLLDKVGKKPSQRIRQATMAEWLGISTRSVRRAVSELIAAGYLATYRTGRSNSYSLSSSLVVTKGDSSVLSDRTNLAYPQSNNFLSNNSGSPSPDNSPKSGREVAAAEDLDPIKEALNTRFREWLDNTLKPLNTHFSELNVEGIYNLKPHTEAYLKLKRIWELGDSSASTGQKLLQAYQEASTKGNIRKPAGFAIKAIPSWLESNIQIKTKPAIPEWCGECDSYGKEKPENRFLDTPEGLKPCPKCHPGSLKKTSQKPQERLSEVQEWGQLLEAVQLTA